MFHPYAMVTGVFDSPLEGYKGPTGCSIICQEFYETDPALDFVRGYSFEMLRGMGPVSTALYGMSSGALPWGQGHHSAYQEIWDRTAGMVIITEDLPEECNQVTLDPDLVDSDGIPGPKALRDTGRLGFNDQPIDPDGVVRRGLLFLNDENGESDYAFALRVASSSSPASILV